MTSQKKKSMYKKSALILSLLIFVLWMMMGTGTSLAWFTDTSEEVQNIFHFAEFQLEVSHQISDGTYELVDGQTNLFDDEALYEPGYVQVVYLKVKNNGTVPFDFKVAVNVLDYSTPTNVFGKTFVLQDHLLFGLVFDETEAGMKDKVANRTLATAAANTKLNRYDTNWAPLDAGDEMYMALIVRMPEEVGNEANYRGTTVPTVKLGVIVEAQQKNTPQ